MADIRKISETRTKDDDGNWDECPYPTVTIESVITGELRKRILTVLQHADSSNEMRLVESQVSSGYSEYTQEDECSIEVMLGTESLWKEECEFSQDNAMAKFLRKFGDS